MGQLEGDGMRVPDWWMVRIGRDECAERGLKWLRYEGTSHRDPSEQKEGSGTFIRHTGGPRIGRYVG